MKFPKALLAASASGASGGDVGEAVDGPGGGGGGGGGGGVSWETRQLNNSQRYCNVDMIEETNGSVRGSVVDADHECKKCANVSWCLSRRVLLVHFLLKRCKPLSRFEAFKVNWGYHMLSGQIWIGLWTTCLSACSFEGFYLFHPPLALALIDVIHCPYKYPAFFLSHCILRTR